MRAILEDAVAVGNATARTIVLRAARVGGLRLLPGLGVVQHAVRRRLRVPGPAAADHRRRRRAPAERRRAQAQLAHRFLYPATGVTPAMCMRLTGIGSQYLIAIARRGRRVPRRRPDLPAHPARRHPREPLLVGDALRQPDPLDARRPTSRMPRLGSQSGTVAAERRRLDRPLLRPRGAGRQGSNWLQTIPGKGWFPILRLYSPLAALLRQDLAAERDRAPQPRRRLRSAAGDRSHARAKGASERSGEPGEEPSGRRARAAGAGTRELSASSTATPSTSPSAWRCTRPST